MSEEASRRRAGDVVSLSDGSAGMVYEIRVHGIGDHDQLSSLGPPEAIDVVAGGRAVVVAPPALPSHRLALVNWSRWNRTGWALGWILSWPFTLLNAAAQMQPGAPGPARFHRGMVHGLSVLATAVTLVWVTASVEVFTRVLPFSDAARSAGGFIAVGAATAGLVSVVAFRTWWRPGPSPRVAVLHISVLLAVAATMLLTRPSQRIVDASSPLLRGFTTDSYTTADFARIPEVYSSGTTSEVIRVTHYLDPLACVGYGALAIAGIALVIAAAVSEKHRSTQLAALSGVIAITIVNLFGALLLATTKALVGGLTRSATVREYIEDQPQLDDVLLIGRTGQGHATRALPMVFVLTLILILIVVALVARVPVGALRDGDRRERLNRWAHVSLPSVGDRLHGATWLAALLVLLVVEFLGLGIGVMEERWGRYDTTNGVESFVPGRPVTLLLTVAGAVLTGALFALRNASLRKRLGASLAFVGDIIGFWPMAFHPFGAQSYRPAAEEAIDRAMARRDGAPTVLVGHSQGSVLAAWYAAHSEPAATDRKTALLTCGSPLLSLYAQFFPSHFGSDLFQVVRANTRYWCNVWRDTDPIATEITWADHNPQSEDPTPTGTLRCHSNYWTDPAQITCVDDLLGLGQAAPAERALVEERN